MRHHKRLGMVGTRLDQPPRGKRGMHHAGALPDSHVLAAGLLLDVVAQVDIGQEEDGFFRGDGVDDLHGVAGGAEDVAFGFDLDRRVDVADYYVVGVVLTEGPDLIGGAAIDQAASGPRDCQLHQYVGRSEGRERYPVYLA